MAITNENIYSFTDLEAMNKEDFIKNFPQTNNRLKKQTGYEVNAKGLIIAIIRASTKRNWTKGDNRGVREFWYNPIKPILMRAVGQRAQTYSGCFENYLSNLVKAGELKYSDLGIQDFTTLRETYMEIDKAKCWTDVVLFVEKDSAYVHLRPLKELFNINIISGSGWSKTASIESQLSQMKDRGITKIKVYRLTDLDPFGFAIGTEFIGKCKVLGFTIVSDRRIGITVEHADPKLIDVQKYPIKKDRKLTDKETGLVYDSDAWLEKYGIDGEYGLEIDAISGQPNGHQRLREIVAEELLKDLKESDRIEEITIGSWLIAPFIAIQRLMRDIDGQNTVFDDIDKPPNDLPTSYVDYGNFSNKWNEIVERKKDATHEIDDRIAGIQKQLEELTAQHHKILKPFDEEQNALAMEYEKGRKVLAHSLWLDYKEQKDDWSKKDYDLGYPEGCLLESVKNGETLQQFLMRIDKEKIVKDIQEELQSDYESEELNIN